MLDIREVGMNLEDFEETGEFIIAQKGDYTECAGDAWLWHGDAWLWHKTEPSRAKHPILKPKEKGMKLEDCKVGMKVRVLRQGEKLSYDWNQFCVHYPDKIAKITAIDQNRDTVLWIKVGSLNWFSPSDLEPYGEKLMEYKRVMY